MSLYATLATVGSHRALLAAALSGRRVKLVEVSAIVGDRGWELGDGSGTLDDRLERSGTAVPVLADASGELVSDDWRWIAEELGRPRFCAAIGVGDDAILEAFDASLYNAGFATEQARYERWSSAVFDLLDELDARLARSSYWSGSEVGLFDALLFPTLYRFELVYHTHFLCCRRRLVDFEHLKSYMQRLYANPKVAATCRPDLVKAHYFGGQRGLNPAGIIPTGPDLDWLTAGPPGGDRDDPVKGAVRRFDS